MRKRFRVALILTVILCVVSTGIGIFLKSGYKDYNAETEPMSHFSVGVLPENMADAQIKRMDAELEKSSALIIAVTCRSPVEFLYSSISQEVKVERVFQGSGVKAGDVIDIVRGGSQIYEEGYDEKDDKKSLNLNFVNVMTPGKKYLVFIDRKIKNSDRYMTADDYIICPVFAYDAMPCKAIASKGSDASYADYEDVKENEWFFTSQKDIVKMQNYQKKMLAKYPLAEK